MHPTIINIITLALASAGCGVMIAQGRAFWIWVYGLIALLNGVIIATRLTN
jgi:hypothetical protein